VSLKAPDPRAFPREQAELATGVRIAYVRAGAGGYPLVLIHGYPETKRIWWRNIEPLAELGFEVIVPDLRGFGDSAPAPDGHYDLSAFARDLYALVHDVLGHERCSTVAGDLGAMVAIDFALRFSGFVERQVIFATALPALGERYRQAGIPPDSPHRSRPESDYFLRQGLEADELIEELPSSKDRVDYVASFYRDRGWAGEGGFTMEEARFMAEPFADRERLRTSWVPYEVAMGVRPPSDRPRWEEPCPVPTLALYGAEDGAIPPSFTRKAKVAFPECVGPFVVPECGHFMQWEQPETLNQAIAHFVKSS
jgi:pimeloyl-ACP methyl ester carboxylesterase